MSNLLVEEKRSEQVAGWQGSGPAPRWVPLIQGQRMLLPPLCALSGADAAFAPLSSFRKAL